MPGSSNAFDFEGNEIIFEESNHKYYSPATENHPYVEYVSGTSLIHRYANSFEKKKTSIAERVAAKRNITADEVIAEWDRNRDEACAFGTRVHETCEDVLLGKSVFRNSPQSEKEARTMEQAKILAGRIKEKMEIVAVEKILFDINLKIAGTADLIVRNPHNGELFLLDWKTNQTIDMSNQYGEKMSGIFSYMDECNFNTYSLQLSLYEYIIKKRKFLPLGTQPIKKYLLHVTENEGKAIRCADFGIEVRDLIIDWLSAPRSC